MMRKRDSVIKKGDRGLAKKGGLLCILELCLKSSQSLCEVICLLLLLTTLRLALANHRSSLKLARPSVQGSREHSVKLE